MAKRRKLTIAGTTIAAGEACDLRLNVSESYTGDPIAIPMRIIRAKKSGPTVCITGAVHGDEINGTGIIRELMYGPPLDLRSGTLILVPIVNSFGFETHSRYLPDRRDLNRCFPGSASGARGSMAARIAGMFFHEVITKCDFGIDLHTAAVRRTNYPNVRADLSDPNVRRIAHAFGCELIVNGKGPLGSLRREACKVGCATIILEAGEVWKIEPGVVEVGARGVRNVLSELGMISGDPVPPAYQTRVDKTTWVRAELGGILSFHIAPGDLIEAGQPIATNVSVVGDAKSILISPADGIVLGMTTLPAVKPGEPVIHIAVPKRRLSAIRRAKTRSAAASANGGSRSIADDLTTSIVVHPADHHDAHWPDHGD